MALGRPEGAAVAAALGVAALLVFSRAPDSGALLLGGFLVAAMLLWIAAADGRDWIIPDGPVIALALLGAAWRLDLSAGGADAVLLDALLVLLDGAVWGGLFLLIREAYFRRRGFDGLGFGDVKLAVAGGILNGSAGFAWALLLASLAGLIAAFAVGLRRGRIERVPFGAFLAPACGIIWLLGQWG